MSRTVRLLAQITRQVALVQYPSLQRSSIRHVELVSLSSTRLILVIIVDTGRVEQRVIECPMPVAEEAIADLRSHLIVALAGKPFSAVPDAVTGFEDTFAEADRPFVRVVLAAVLESVAERHDERVVLGGTAHLARYGEAFPLAIQPVLEALEEQVVLLRLLGEATNPQGITVRIGHENPVEGLEATSVITAQYARGDQAVASLGVVGPTHMDYPGTMAAVHAVARYVSRILDEQ